MRANPKHLIGYGSAMFVGQIEKGAHCTGFFSRIHKEIREKNSKTRRLTVGN